jgi:signal peptidase II
VARPHPAGFGGNARVHPAVWYAGSLLIVLLDQATKRYMTAILPLCGVQVCETIEVLPVFRLVMLHNEGAAFSFLSDAGGWQKWFLVAISASVSGVLCLWLARIRRAEALQGAALTFILGGAAGNLVDRMRHGYVVDFLLAHYGDAFFPAFNLADAAITLGAALLLLDMLRLGAKRVPSPGAPR